MELKRECEKTNLYFISVKKLKFETFHKNEKLAKFASNFVI